MNSTRGDSRPGTSVPGLCLFISVLSIAALVRPASAQNVLDTKQRFVTALIQFLDALPATYGDEGPRLTAAVEAMAAGLSRWDSAIRATESATAAQLEGTRPTIAAALRVPVGALYLERGRIDEAVKEFTEAARLNPERPDIQLFRGLTFTVGARPVDAANAFRLAWQRDRSNAVAAYLTLQQSAASGSTADTSDVLMALAASPRGTARQAPFLDVSLLEGASTDEPLFPPAAYAEAFRLLSARRYEEAVARLRRDVASDPAAVDPALRRPAIVEAIDLLRRGKIATAIERLTGSVELSSNSSEVHRLLGTAYWFDYEREKSVAQFEAAIKIDTRDERSRLLMADALVEDEQLAKAEQALRETLVALPESARARWKLARLYQRMGRDAEALRELTQLKSAALTGAGLLHATVGALHLAAGDAPQAIEAYRLRLGVNPNNPAAHRDLAEAYLKAGRQDDAWAELLAALLIDPADADALAALGQIHLVAGRFPDAIGAFERAVAWNPRHKTARYGLGNALLRSGREDDGRRELETFRTLQADAVDADHRSYELSQLKLEAALRTGEGMHAEAAALWRQVVEREPDVPANHVRLGRALARAGRDDQAIAAFERALTLEPGAALHRELAGWYMRAGRTQDSTRERALYSQLREDELRILGTGR